MRFEILILKFYFLGLVFSRVKINMKEIRPTSKTCNIKTCPLLVCADVIRETRKNIIQYTSLYPSRPIIKRL